ncbi:MAG: hypothetical protein DMG68_00230 [Acidobacteria bacterium]|jgi:hypothetical protein|nr:MAG: hypothetical protein DMG68_00230 [Acidobacteriota bacterium]
MVLVRFSTAQYLLDSCIGALADLRYTSEHHTHKKEAKAWAFFVALRSKVMVIGSHCARRELLDPV